MTSATRALNNWLEMWLNLVIWTTTTVIRIVARDDACELSTSCENFTPKKATQLFLTVSGPNLLYKILFLWNRNAKAVATQLYASTGKLVNSWKPSLFNAIEHKTAKENHEAGELQKHICCVPSDVHGHAHRENECGQRYSTRVS